MNIFRTNCGLLKGQITLPYQSLRNYFPHETSVHFYQTIRRHKREDRKRNYSFKKNFQFINFIFVSIRTKELDIFPIYKNQNLHKKTEKILCDYICLMCKIWGGGFIM